MFTAKLAAVATESYANAQHLVSADRAKRRSVEVYEKDGREVTVLSWPGKMVVKMRGHGETAEFATRKGDTRRCVDAIVARILQAADTASARNLMRAAIATF